MKKFLLLSILTLFVSSAFAEVSNDTTPVNNQYVSNYQAPKSTSNSGAGICKNLMATIINIGGMAPYSAQPDNNNFWPRFNVQGGAGYIYKFITAEAMIEYMQANTNSPSEPTNYYNLVLGSARFGVVVPIQITDKVLLMPNIKGRLGGAFYIGSGFTSQFVAGAIGGLDFGFRIGNKNMFLLGFIYEYRWFINGSKNYNMGMMGGQIAITF